ncbi:alpha/beta fold hydrolase [Ureibacillus acetophenoni]|uniref:Pimeloyl-ACP methyl ester carboxylesterase n=1 Tax=Ureibacillus acetophenoni TaxID=614649 RepID=A0A285UI35_9BACL|nr:alpha/beta fold hydrolase [Ureibacillus acetophenoni]SOC41433.1 pimeloyl-ACP methyl ester carboxylesterase [Ureibacillus acetophenoni]
MNKFSNETNEFFTNKHELYYETITNHAHKEWIVLFHGLGGNCSIFYKQIPTLKEQYNLLLIDLPGHGESSNLPSEEANTLYATSKLVIDILDKENIESAHFVGVSSGTILMQYLAMHFPNRIQSMVLAGASGKWRKWGEILGKTTLAKGIRNLLPYKLPYVTFAYILMPKVNHKKSRGIFIREANKLSKQSYLRWAFVIRDSYKIYNELSKLTNEIPKLYICGNEDHMFIDGIKSHVQNEKNSNLYIIDKCGHVCNIEKPLEFNQLTLDFIKNQSTQLPSVREEKIKIHSGTSIKKVS